MHGIKLRACGRLCLVPPGRSDDGWLRELFLAPRQSATNVGHFGLLPTKILEAHPKAAWPKAYTRRFSCYESQKDKRVGDILIKKYSRLLLGRVLKGKILLVRDNTR